MAVACVSLLHHIQHSQQNQTFTLLTASVTYATMLQANQLPSGLEYETKQKQKA